MGPEGVSLNTEVLIVGAGPTGLVLALWLNRLGIRVRIIDKTAEPGTTSRCSAPTRWLQPCWSCWRTEVTCASSEGTCRTTCQACFRRNGAAPR